MPDDRNTSNELSGEAGRPGDVPDTLRRRYFLDEKSGPGLGFHVDAQTTVAAFRDQGRTLTTTRNDPNAIRDMTAIAVHRGWSIVTARGSPEFRREAWLEGRAAGLDVKGYRPTERDLQDLERRTVGRNRYAARTSDPAGTHILGAPTAPRDHLAVVKGVVRARIVSAEAQERVMTAARHRVERWMERGAKFDPLRAPVRPSELEPGLRRERQR